MIGIADWMICRVCNAEIPYNTRFVTLNLNVEKSPNGRFIDVAHVDMLAVWCCACAPSSAAISAAITSIETHA